MKRICNLFLILALLLSFVACEQNVSGEADSEAIPNDPVITFDDSPTEPAKESGTKEESVSIVGTWHYEKSSQDCFIAFYSDGTGLIHYYQNYGQQTALTGYVNKGIRSWSYSQETCFLHITIAGSNITSAINTDQSFTYVVSELTDSVLVIKNNGAYDSAVPINKELSREMSQSLQ